MAVTRNENQKPKIAAGPQAAGYNGLKGLNQGTAQQVNRYQGGYQPGQAAQAAQQRLEQVQGQKPQGFNGKYGAALDGILEKIQNPDEFKYEFNGDNLFKAYADMYTQKGRQASMDAMGQAAALTGGYGNSYAQQVGNQHYDQYLMDLYGIGMDLRDRAYQAHQDRRADLYNQAGMLGQQDDREYGRYRDDVGDWQAERDYYTDRADREREFDYNTWAADRDYWTDMAQRENADWWKGQDFEEDRRRYEQDFAEDRRRDERDYAEDVRRYDQDYAENARRYDQDFAEDQRRYDQDFAENRRRDERDFAEDQRRDERNYAEDVRRYDQDYAENARRYDQDFAEDQRRYNQDFMENLNRDRRDYGEDVRRYDQDFAENRRRDERDFAEDVRRDDRNYAENRRQFNAGLEEDARQFNERMAADERQFEAQMEENVRQFDASLDWDKLTTEQKYAASWVEAILANGEMPSEEMLLAAGLSAEDAQKLMAKIEEGGSGTGGGGKKKTTENGLTGMTFKQANEKVFRETADELGDVPLSVFGYNDTRTLNEIREQTDQAIAKRDKDRAAKEAEKNSSSATAALQGDMTALLKDLEKKGIKGK